MKVKKLTLTILIISACFTTHAQKGFELDVTARLGYYFPPKPVWIPADLFVSDAFSPAAGISLGYNFLKNTGVFLGVEYAYLSPDMKDMFTHNNINVKWQSVSIPLNIQQGICRNLFLTAGATLVRQLTGYSTGVSAFAQQEIPEFNWQAGAGYKLKDLRISFQYSRGFSAIDKSIKTSTTSYSGVSVRHQEVFLKLEHPVWRF